jgi:hypothetical protein
VLQQMRAKQLTKDLSLTEEQQKKVQVLYAAEAKELSAVQADENLTLVQKADKQLAIKAATREKIKPLLTDEQKTKWETILAKQNKPKKKPAAPAAPAAAPAAK